MNRDRLQDLAQTAVKFALKYKADQVQAAAFLVDSTLTRYANSQIHQNIASKKGGVITKVAVDQRVGTLRVNSLEKKEIQEAVYKAVKIARATPVNEDFRSFPEPERWEPIVGAFDKETAESTPDFRADGVKNAIDRAHSESNNVKAVAGSFYAGSYAFAVANSLGVSSWAEATTSSFQTTVISHHKGSKGFGSAAQHSRTIRDIDPVAVAAKAAEKSVRSINPKKIAVGDYEVVLSPRAFAGLLMYLGYIAFSATIYQDGQSFVKYNLNKQVFDEKLHVDDDPRDGRTLYAFPIDGEGVPKKKKTLIEEGRVSEESICYDSFTAGKEGKKSTGHSFPPIFGFYSRPLPINVTVATGGSTIDEMTEETKHGIFITRFHYTNPVEPTKAILTGLTRDGTFLIEDGEITTPIMNLRYTDSMLSALKTIPMIGNTSHIVEDVVTPAVKLEKLRFTGVTKH